MFLQESSESISRSSLFKAQVFGVGSRFYRGPLGGAAQKAVSSASVMRADFEGHIYGGQRE